MDAKVWRPVVTSTTSDGIDNDGRLTFGKHKGRTIDSVPRAYLRWLVSNASGALTADDVRVIEAELQHGKNR